MKKLFVSAAALLISLSGFAQNPNLDFKFALKGYNQTTYSNQTQQVGNGNLASHYLNFFQPVVGLQWQTKSHNAHEFALNYLAGHVYEGKVYSNTGPNGNGQITDERSGRYFNLSFSYDYQLLFNKQKDTKLVPAIGIGLSPYFSLDKYSFNGDLQARNITTTIGGKVMVTPRLMYFISPKLFFDAHIPFCLIDIQSNSYQQESSQGPSEMDGMGTVEGNAFPKVYQLQLGLGLKL